MGKSASAWPASWRRKLTSPGRDLPARAERETPMNPSLTGQLVTDRQASLLAEARRRHQAAAARRARPSTKMPSSSSNRSSGSASANSLARLVMFGKRLIGSDAM